MDLHLINRMRKILFIIYLITLAGISGYGQISRIPTEGETDSGLGGGNVIEGLVQLPSGQRLDRRIRVRLYTSTRGDVTSMTDDTGKFVFRGLVGGDYTVVIDGEKEFETTSQPVNIIQFRGAPSQVYSLQMRLVPKSNDLQKPGVVSAEFANVPEKALNSYKKGIELAKMRDFKGAVKQFEQATAEYPKFMFAFNEMGIQYLRLNEIEKADEAFQSALRIEPEAFTPLINRGIVASRFNKFSDAEKYIKSALNSNQKSAIAHFYLAQAIANQNRFDEAEKEFNLSVKFGGDEMMESHRYLAIIYINRGDKKRAIPELETYLKLAPTTPDAQQLQNLIRKLKGLDSKPLTK